jgi:hemerythrin superfamily protein
MPGSSRSKFNNLFKLVKVVLVIIHSNAEEESLFSRVRKNLTAQRPSLSLDGTLSSVICFQLNRKQVVTRYHYQPSESVISSSQIH